MMKCNVCGNEVNEGANECAVCGAKIEIQVSQEEAKKGKFFDQKAQVLFVGFIGLFLLFYFVLNNLIMYSNLRNWDGDLIPLGIGGIIFSIPMLIAAVALIVFQFLFIFMPFEKLGAKLVPFIGFITHAVISVCAFILAVWGAAARGGANFFFNQILFIFGLQAIHIWLYMIIFSLKNIFPKKPDKPSQVMEEAKKEGE